MVSFFNKRLIFLQISFFANSFKKIHEMLNEVLLHKYTLGFKVFRYTKTVKEMNWKNYVEKQYFNQNVELSDSKSVQISRFYWSVFSDIRTGYGDLQSKSPYSVRIQKIRTRKISVFGHFHVVSGTDNPFIFGLL